MLFIRNQHPQVGIEPTKIALTQWIFAARRHFAELNSEGDFASIMKFLKPICAIRFFHDSLCNAYSNISKVDYIIKHYFNSKVDESRSIDILEAIGKIKVRPEEVAVA